MTKPRTTFLRDRTSGVLITVLSLFVIYFAWYMTNFIPIVNLIIAFLAFRLAQFMVGVAYYLFKGLDVDLS